MKPTTAGPSRPTSVALVALALLAGCAAMSDGECRSADWYQVGYRDGILALQDQHDLYAESCGKHGAKIDVALYTSGWTDGRFEANRRNKEATY